MASEQTRFDILINAKAAIKELREMSQAATSVQDRVAKFSAFLIQKSREWNVPLRQLLNTFRELDAQLATSGRKNIFGDRFQTTFNMAEGFLKSAQAAGRFTTSANGVVESVRKINGGMDNVAGATRHATGEFEILGNRINVVRTAFGTLLAMAIFQFMNMVSQALSRLIANLRETELAVYNLINAERRLSKEGIGITPKDLQDIIDKVRELVPILSQIQAEELVSRIATNVAPALKLTREQISQMAEATALLYIRNKALGKSFEEVESQLTNAFLTGKVSQGINNLGVKLSDQIVKDEALRLGLVETAEEFNNLTGEMEAQVKASAMLSVVYKNATQDAESLGEYMETTDAKIEKARKNWDDILTMVSEIFAPAINMLLNVLDFFLQAVIQDIEFLAPILKETMAIVSAEILTFADALQNAEFGKGLDYYVKNFDKNHQMILDSFDGLAEAVDTPTEAIDNLQETLDEFDGEKFGNQIEDILDDAKNAREDLARSVFEKTQDINEEYRRKALDAEVDYTRKVEDINRDYERDLAKLKDKQRAADLKAEEDYQNKLWELRMRYLMNLEDALHARDARQVIRLQKQYEIDKEALARKQNLDDKQRSEDQKAEQEDLALKRQQKLEDAKREFEERLADQRLAKQREFEDLAIWYKREYDDLQKNIERKLQALIAGWVQEKKITEQNAAEVYAILSKYFGPGGMTEQLYKYLAEQLRVNLTAPLLPGIGVAEKKDAGSRIGGVGSAGGRRSTTGGASKTTDGIPVPQLAEGGTFIATRPTTVTFGEAGAEMAQFTPLGRIGADVNKVFMNGDKGGGIGGQITVALNLSPDLEARVVEQSVNGVADVILKVNRTKS